MSAPVTVSFSRRNFAPVIFLSVGGNDANDLLGTLLSFDYNQSLKKGAETKFVFRNDEMRLMEDPRFMANVSWSFRFGYFHDMSPIITGQIRQVEPVYDQKRTVTVTLLDGSLQLSKSSEGKNWGRVKSSDICRALAKKYNMEVAVDDSNDVPSHDFVQPASVNDLEYLRDLAVDINFEVFVDGNPPTLIFRKPTMDAASDARRIIYYSDPSEYAFVKNFKPKIKSLGPEKTAVSKTDSETGKSKSNTSDKGSSSFAARDEIYGPIDNSGFSKTVARHGIYGPVDNAVTTTKITYVTDPDTGGFKKKVTTQVTRNKPVTDPAASGADTRGLSAAKRQQMLDKAQEATSDHPLTASFQIGKAYQWAGLDGPLNRAWYCEEISCHIDGSGSTTSIKWKRDDPKEKKVDNKKDSGVVTLPEINIAVKPPAVRIDPDSGAQSRREPSRPAGAPQHGATSSWDAPGGSGVSDFGPGKSGAF